MYEYNEEFYRYISEGSAQSARRVLPELLDVLPFRPDSVLDVGCGAGAWLGVWKSLGAQVLGLDGDYVQPGQMLIDPGEFQAADLGQAFDLGRRFSLVQSLEVAEHLPASSAAEFVDSLCRHSDLVLFSAAPPGQGGENHVNEQPYDYWRALFGNQGYAIYDPLRPRLLDDADVKPWYRYNTFVYLNDEAPAALRDALSGYAIPGDSPVPDLSPAAYRLRKRAVALLPRAASTALARIKKGYFNTRSRLSSGAR